MKWLWLFLVPLFNSHLYSQDLFEKAVGGDTLGAAISQRTAFELNGYLRGDFYAGKVPNEDKAEMKSGYSELSLKFRIRRQDLGDAFAEVRFRWGHEFGEKIDEVGIREVYVSTYVGRFDFRLGRQIVVWGRADGFNPTDNITPEDPLVRSPNEDDRREGNFIIRSYFNYQPLRIEAIWVPIYEASVLPTSILSLPPGITFMAPDFPGANLENNSFALKTNLELASFDGSLSYFNGYNPSPGIGIVAKRVTPTGIEIDIMPRAYRLHVLGADFSTSLLRSIGLRGEFAYGMPFDDWESAYYIPNPDLQYVIGIDKEFDGTFSIILQYVGRHVFDFIDLAPPASPTEIPEHQIAFRNRLITFQRDEVIHAVSFRPEVKLMYETLSLEILGLYSFTTEELVLRPQAAYDIADALTFAVGGEIYSGPEDTLYGSLDSQLSAFFVELKSSF
ncbi:MAG: hypothetical protein GTO51_03155 [Candidatus Latescibacteria bacterium]|nr:hypothetical protein [Candidatus Latescibacterota bacterium]NIM22683.1 hypothetical protein [Candidatus Latescibacterota bacterium]NIM64972.1 hypothetical protein [Candidatus Latescibacterota bacterium]NIO01487.1 hypothetical protein [Candidatus Latescibacterota bacterium]NIO27997.1 hypothetical protein [Candidatus Latescibacterota bacterium]